VALHRGRVRVLDRPGGTGTRFEVRLPAQGHDGKAVALPPRRDWMIGTAAEVAAAPPVLRR
jgi:two-component system sensor histidine kinase PrrB